MSPSSICLIVSLAEAARSRGIGEKAASISKLVAARFAVPRGFVIAADAYRSHLWASGARDLAASVASAEDRERLRAAILASEIPADIGGAIAEAYERLSWQLAANNPKVAVRSSALEDGLAETSFAGAYETSLNICGIEALLAAVKRTWASLWTGKAAAFRSRFLTSCEPAMAVIVQQMIDAAVFGTALTASPVTGDPHRVLISCAAAEAPTKLSYSSVDLRAPGRVGRKDEEAIPDDDTLALVAERALIVEEAVGGPIEMQWARDGSTLWMLQARGIGELPAFFPGPDGPESRADGAWRRVTARPISHFARSLLPEAGEAGAALALNGYLYRRADQVGESSGRAGGIARGLRAVAQWEREVGPELRTSARRIIAADLARLGHARLRLALREAADLSTRAAGWLEQMRLLCVRFPALLRGLVGERTEDASLFDRLLGGLPDATLKRDAELWELGERFAAAESSGRLEDAGWWHEYKRDVESFARLYGYAFRSAGEMADVASWRSWVEDLDSAFRIVGALARQDKRQSIVTLHSAAARTAGQAAREAAKLFAGRERARFEKLLSLSRGALAARSDCELACALTSTALRLVAIELGRRLCESGVIAGSQDVFCLTLGELCAPHFSATDGDRSSIAALVARRKHELWLDGRLTAPERLALDAEGDRAVESPNGSAASADQVSGRARVATSFEEAGEIECGEVLVVESPMLAWTPFLAVAGGFVSEAAPEDPGWAARARDYGVPAVLGCPGIMSKVRNGQRVRIDGSTGLAEDGRPVGGVSDADPSASGSENPPTGTLSAGR